ncbi:MAG TPA: GFA family protein [Chthoniobacterales bacterium]
MAIKLITGGCHCGAVRYEAAEPPSTVSHCHCVDCRRSSGAPFVTWATFPRNAVHFRGNEPRQFLREGRLRGFCAQCGTSVTFLVGADAGAIDVTVGSFDEPETVLPTCHSWVEDRLSWTPLADELPAYAQALPEGVP